MSRRVSKRPATQRFDRAPQANIPRSTFDLSHPVKTTFNSGELIPLPPLEVIPGDSFRLRMYALTRLATPLHPTMDNLRLSSFFFFVPNRLVHDDWQKLMGEQDNPGDSTDFLTPAVSLDSTSVTGSIWDYMGLPLFADLTGGATTVSALPLRGHNLIYNEWFRDENLQNSLEVRTDAGPDPSNIYSVQRRGKRKDYLTSALPWPQKGPASEIPLGTSAPVIIQNSGTGNTITAVDSVGVDKQLDSSGPILIQGVTGTGSALAADLSSATGATINDWREAFQIQKLKERDARGGTRYTEIIQSHFRVISPDARLQRPEYLGGGVTPVSMRSVPQTSSTDATTPQGNLSAYGEGTVANHGFTKSFVEHGYILGFISVQADLNYQQKIDRHWRRRSKYDFYWPALQALGEEPIYNYEIWADGSANDDLAWGYQERWAAYRQQLGHITGLFRSSATGSLDPWHYALDFVSRPALDSTFIEDVPPVKRTIAVQSEPEFLFDAWMDVKAARPMPVYSVPGYIDHF